MIKAYLTNLGKYNEGELKGEYLTLPATREDVKALLQRIQVDRVEYEEIIITDYETEIDNLYRHLGEYESIDELNYLAAILENLSKQDLEKFESALALGEYTGCLQSIINLAQNLHCYEVYPEVRNEEELARYLIQELKYEEIPERLENYFDYESYGQSEHINIGGDFINGEYVFLNNNEKFAEYYKGRHIPDDYRIFAYPDKLPIKEQLKQYTEIANKNNTQPRDKMSQRHPCHPKSQEL